VKEEFIPALPFPSLIPFYDLGAEISGHGRRLNRKVLKLAQIQEGERILDVGCGSGTFLVEAQKELSHSKAIGLDPDERMLQIAWNKLRQAGVNAELVEGLAQTMPFTNASFDVVVSALTFHHLPTSIKKMAVEEIFRVLVEQGRFLLVDFGKPNTLVETVFLSLASIFEEKDSMRANLAGELPTLLEQSNFAVQIASPRYRGVEFLVGIKKQ
jgi:ubiquinone/menaquinone biosynthesis C-methylase UbiE